MASVHTSYIIGASLSKPHTDCIVHACVYLASYAFLDRPLTKWSHSNISQRLILCREAIEGLLSECSIRDPKRKSEHTWHWFVLLLTTAGRSQAVQIQYGWWLTGSLQVAGHTALIDTRNLAHDFSIKFNPCMCTHVSCPGWRNGWHMCIYLW